MGKSYTASYAELNSFCKSFCKVMDEWKAALTGIDGAVTALASSNNISGATADRMRNYFNDIHGKTIESLLNSIDILSGLCKAYQTAYLSQVDSGPDFYIPSNKVQSINSKMAGYQTESEQLDAEAKAVLNRISSIFSPPCPLVETDPAIYEALSKDIKDMLTALDQVESDYKAEVESVVSGLDATLQTIRANINQDKIHKKTYTAADNGAEFNTMVATTAAIKQFLAQNRSYFDAADDAIKQYNEKLDEFHIEQAEREKREQLIKNIKLGLTIAKAAAGVAVIALTGGAGAPFVIATIGVGVGFGAMGEGLDAFGEQYIEGGTANLDWGKIGRKAFVGGVKGGITSAITVGVGAGFEQLGNMAVISDLTSSASPFIKEGVKLGMNVLEDECTKIVGGGIGRLLDAGSEDFVKNGTLSFDLDKGMDSAFDRAAILNDSVNSLTDTVVSFGIEKAGEGLFGLDKITKDTKINGKMVGAHAVIGTASELGSGIFSRGAGTLAEDLYVGMSFRDAKNDALKQALDGDKMLNDAASGLVKGSFKPYTSKRKDEEKSHREAIEKFKEEIKKNTEKYGDPNGTANTRKELKILKEVHEKGDWDDIEDEDVKIRKNINSANYARERKILSDMYDNGEMEPTVDRQSGSVPQDKKTRIVESFVDQNVTKSRLPKQNGHWSDPDKPGNSMWIPDDDATFKYKSGGKELTMTYGELKRKYHIEGIEYKNNDPVFNTPQIADQRIGTVDFDRMPTHRQGKGGSYEQFYETADDRVGGDSKAYMEKNGLTVHEGADRRTVVAVPVEINAAFPHTGGISMQRSIEAVGDAWNEEFEGRTLSLNRENTPTGQVKDFDPDQIHKGLKEHYSSYKKNK